MSIGKIIAAVMILVVLRVFGNAVFGWVAAVGGAGSGG